VIPTGGTRIVFLILLHSSQAKICHLGKNPSGRRILAPVPRFPALSFCFPSSAIGAPFTSLQILFRTYRISQATTAQPALKINDRPYPSAAWI